MQKGKYSVTTIGAGGGGGSMDSQRAQAIANTEKEIRELDQQRAFHLGLAAKYAEQIQTRKAMLTLIRDGAR